jgi:hypothetical protein
MVGDHWDEGVCAASDFVDVVFDHDEEDAAWCVFFDDAAPGLAGGEGDGYGDDEGGFADAWWSGEHDQSAARECAVAADPPAWWDGGFVVHDGGVEWEDGWRLWWRGHACGCQWSELLPRFLERAVEAVVFVEVSE